MTHTITFLPGDGIGPEVGAAARRVLDAVARASGASVAIAEHAFGGAAIDAHGTPFPEATRAAALAVDAVLLGAIGGPKWETLPGDQRPERGLLDLRAALGAWANLRIFKPYPAAAALSPVKADRLAGVDILVVRELTGGIYFGEKRREGDRAVDVCAYSAPEIERVARRAGELARGRGKRVASIDKANVMETSRLWRETVSRVMADEFPDVALEHVLVDAAAMHLINQPARFDVVVTENLFGDVLTDEAAVLCGSLGLVPSASLGEGSRGLYEPIHGSAPDIAGQGKANPIGMIASSALMLRWSLGLAREADAVEAAIAGALADGLATADLQGSASTDEMAAAIADRAAAALSA
ncbi:MAG: 3-isopropylmalate dehydrogenase [Caulobacterales bacterium]|nr:3-isopropylmalate dehydrogenase [Caulobacterales bacterium]